MADMNNLHIGNEVMKVMRMKNMTTMGLAGAVGIDPSAMGKLLKNKYMNTERLVEISDALSFNFFSLYAPTAQLEEELKKKEQDVKDLQWQVADGERKLVELERKIAELEKENKMLKDFLEVLKKR